MDNRLSIFEGKEVLILFPKDVNFQFEGDFIINTGDVATILEYSRTENVLRHCKDKHVYAVKNSNISDALNRSIRKLNNAGESFISNLSLNRVLGKSEQPKAEPFQDWLYEDILPNVQKTGSYELPGGSKYQAWLKKAEAHIKFAKLLSDASGVKPGIAIAAAIGEAEKETGRSLDVYKKLIPAADHDTGILTPTLIAEKAGLKSSIAANKLLEEMGLQYSEKTTRKSKSTNQDKEVKIWRLTDEGKKYAEEFPFVKNGHSGYQIKWSDEVLNLIQKKSA